mmetsp:Transcript_47357/g.72361  ORF Transcript_47357/g.72361 Transcript_47357/m.72361 type:complete len:91 (+) Transcript_47357:546-818(+)
MVGMYVRQGNDARLLLQSRNLRVGIVIFQIILLDQTPLFRGGIFFQKEEGKKRASVKSVAFPIPSPAPLSETSPTSSPSPGGTPMATASC